MYSKDQIQRVFCSATLSKQDLQSLKPLMRGMGAYFIKVVGTQAEHTRYYFRPMPEEPLEYLKAVLAQPGQFLVFCDQDWAIRMETFLRRQ